MDGFEERYHIPLSVTYFSAGEILLEEVEEYDLIFLDIGMPGMDGIMFGRKARRWGYEGKIIMLTGMPERFREAFEIEAFRFVTKPFEREELFRAVLDYANTRVGQREIEVFRDRRRISLKENQIFYIMHNQGGSYVYTKSEQFHSDLSLAAWERKLESRLFVRSNRQYIVNVAHILEVGMQIKLADIKELVPYSRRKKKKIQRVMDEYDLYYR